MQIQSEELIIAQTLESGRALPDSVHLSLAADLLLSFGELRLSPLGTSMVPTIFPGEVLTICRQKASAIEAGDIVLTTRGNRFFVHRILRKSKSGDGLRLLTQGDALLQPDPPFAENELLGRATWIERGGKKKPVRPHLTWFEKCLQWGVRRSDFFLGIVLRAHSLYRHCWPMTVGVRRGKLRRSH